MRKQLMIPALLALSVGLAACATPPNQYLDMSRTNFTSLQTNPKANSLAALETKDASEWLDKAEMAYKNKEDKPKVDQLAYLTNQRVELAKESPCAAPKSSSKAPPPRAPRPCWMPVTPRSRSCRTASTPSRPTAAPWSPSATCCST
jgi:hypothetical protein